MLWKTNELLLLVGLIATYWIATEAGYRLGVARGAGRDESDKAHMGALQSSLLSLLALLLGFSFAMAVSRFDTRKSLVLREVNAIGTTYVRSDFLQVEERQQTRDLLRAYVDVRSKYVDQDISEGQVEEVYRTGKDLQKKLWVVATAAVARDPSSEATALFVSSLNELIEVSEARRAAFGNHVPGAVVLMLVIISCGALIFIGFNCGVAGRRRIPSTTSFIVLSVMVLITILDVDRPRNGLILVNQDAMLRLQAALAADAQ